MIFALKLIAGILAVVLVVGFGLFVYALWKMSDVDDGSEHE